MVLVWRVGGCLQGSGVKSRRVFCMVLHGSGVEVGMVLQGSGVESRRVSAGFWCEK